MAQTPNYGWTYPAPGGSNGAWAGILNALFLAVDASLKAVETVATAALPKSGGALTGRTDLKTVSIARVDKGAISGAQAFDVATAQYFTLTLSGPLTPSFANVPVGTWAQAVVFRVTNGGAFVITWPGSIKWVSGAVPTLTANGVDLLGFITDDNGVTWRGLILGKDLR